MPVHDEMLHLLAECPSEQIKALLAKNTDALAKFFKEHYLADEDHELSVRPGSQEAAELATLDDQRRRMAAETWTRLTPSECQAILDTVEALGEDPYDFQEEVELYIDSDCQSSSYSFVPSAPDGLGDNNNDPLTDNPSCNETSTPKSDGILTPRQRDQWLDAENWTLSEEQRASIPKRPIDMAKMKAAGFKKTPVPPETVKMLREERLSRKV